jgi:hypothetical protein
MQVFNMDLPNSGGVGARYIVSEKNRIGMRLDFAWGEDERVVYLSVGEAF